MKNPSEYLSIDETLYPYRGNVKFRQYNSSKPARYGLLYRSISDSRVPYTYFTLAYAGKLESQPYDAAIGSKMFRRNGRSSKWKVAVVMRSRRNGKS